MVKSIQHFSKLIYHIGMGNFHKSHQAFILNKLYKTCNQSQMWGINGIELKQQNFKHNLRFPFNYNVIEKNDTQTVKTSIKSINHITYNPNHIDIENINHSMLKMITMTITEKGYYHNNLLENNEIVDDLNYIGYYLERKHIELYKYPFTKFTANNELLCNKWIKTKTLQSVYGVLFQILYTRYLYHYKGVSILSCDNIINNSKLLKTSLFQFIDFVHLDTNEQIKFKNWIQYNVTFPNTMVDRITPYSKSKDNIDVLCEPYFKWVIEDEFINEHGEHLEKPSYEKVGVLFCKSNELTIHEKIKLEFLNGSHSLIAYISFRFHLGNVHDVVSNTICKTFIYKYMNALLCFYDKHTIQHYAVVTYIDNIIYRFNNIHISDSVLRLREDGGNKLKCIYMRIMKEIKQYMSKKVIDKSIFLDLTLPIKYYFEYIDTVNIDELEKDSIGLHMKTNNMDFNKKINYLFEDRDLVYIFKRYYKT